MFSCCRPVQVFDDKDGVDINDQYWQLRAEAIPEDQLSVSEQDQLIPLYHFSCDQHATVSTSVLCYPTPPLFPVNCVGLKQAEMCIVLLESKW